MHVVKVRSTYYFILLMWGPCLGADQSLGVSLLWCGLPCGPWSLRIPSLLQGSSQEFISSHIPHSVPFHMPFPMSLDFYYFFFSFCTSFPWQLLLAVKHRRAEVWAPLAAVLVWDHFHRHWSRLGQHAASSHTGHPAASCCQNPTVCTQYRCIFFCSVMLKK